MLDLPIHPRLLTRIHAAVADPVGYHGGCWYDTDLPVDGGVADPLAAFLEAVHHTATRPPAITQHVGPAYLRVVDAAHPDTGMRWHRDNADGGIRFTTAVTTDRHPINIAFAHDGAVEGQTTDHLPAAYRPSNGRLVVFGTELHGLLPTRPRPGHRTAVFFATLYRSPVDADLHSTRCHGPDGVHPYAPQVAGDPR